MTLAEYLHEYLGGLANQLNWTVAGGSYAGIVNQSLEMLGVSDESDVTDILKLHKIGIYQLWKKVVRELSLDFNFSADGASYSRSQAFEHCKQNLIDATYEILEYLPTYKIPVVQVPVRNQHAPNRHF